MANETSTIRDAPVVRRASLPDGRTVDVRVVVPDDPYLARRSLDTVVVELEAGNVLGVVATPLEPEDTERGIMLAERIRDGLESGALEPTAAGIEGVASTVPL